MNSELQRIVDASRSPGWSIGEGQAGQIMATFETPEIGMPWVVLAVKRGKGLKVSLYAPGDDVTVEGEEIGEVSGNPREQGRQLREILEGVKDEKGL
jgi:hypothetical protein